LATESQSRFEKGVSPVLAQVAVKMAIGLLEKHAQAELVEVVDCNKIQSEKQIIKFNTDNIEKLLGEKVKTEEAFQILENLICNTIIKTTGDLSSIYVEVMTETCHRLI
jgi:phenylalanyl-tRNA synthetase beta chain